MIKYENIWNIYAISRKLCNQEEKICHIYAIISKLYIQDSKVSVIKKYGTYVH